MPATIRGEGRPAWPVAAAWALWLLTVLTLAAVPLLDRLVGRGCGPAERCADAGE